MLNDLVEVLPHAEWEATASLLASEQTRATSALTAIDETAGPDGLRLAHYCTIEELVGLAFGAMTVLYIVTSLASLS